MVAKIIAVKEIPLASLVLGKGQVRVRDVGNKIDALAESIAEFGQLQPIVVCPAREQGKFRLLTGWRCYLAHKQLRKEKIMACILDHEVDEKNAKIISDMDSH